MLPDRCGGDEYLRQCVAAWVASLTPVAAYYHYNHYLFSGAVIQEKFDLNALPNRTLTFFVSQADPNSVAVRRPMTAWPP